MLDLWPLWDVPSNRCQQDTEVQTRVEYVVVAWKAAKTLGYGVQHANPYLLAHNVVQSRCLILLQNNSCCIDSASLQPLVPSQSSYGLQGPEASGVLQQRGSHLLGAAGMISHQQQPWLLRALQHPNVWLQVTDHCSRGELHKHICRLSLF